MRTGLRRALSGIAVGALSAAVQAHPAPDSTVFPYASTQDSARLTDGRTIHLVCMGQGSPIVILTAGGSGWSINWAKVQPGVAAKTRVCSWDPAGMGLSSPSSQPQTSDNLTSDIQGALKARGINGPYVMVGHSLGAYPSLLMADRWPSRVVGMVLVDPSIPDQTAIFDRVTPAQSTYLRALLDAVPFLEKCAGELRSGSVHLGGPDPDGCLRPPDWPPNWPAGFRAALNKNFVGASPNTIAAALTSIASNMKAGDPKWGDPDSKIVMNPARNYRDMPLIVLTHSDFNAPPDYPAAAKAEIPAEEAEWRRGHDAYAALSTRGVNRIVPNSTHQMPDEKPEVVIEAINTVVDEARQLPPLDRRK